MIRNRPIDPERHTFKPPEATDDEGNTNSKRYYFCLVSKSAGGENEVIQEVGEH
jgi:hypothetical protein